MRKRNRLAKGILALGLIACGGCMPSGPETYRVTGEVSVNGQPLPNGLIVFRSSDGRTVSSAGPVVDGRFDFEAMPGAKKVVITAVREVPGKFESSNPGEKIQVTEQYLPPKYNTDTKLEAVVSDDGQDFKFDLQS